MTKTTYRVSKSLDERIAESKRISDKYPNRALVILERAVNSNLPICENKFIIPFDRTYGDLIAIIRRHMKLPPEKAIFMLVNGKYLIATSEYIGNVYKNYKSEDNILYIVYTEENTFG